MQDFSSSTNVYDQIDDHRYETIKEEDEAPNVAQKNVSKLNMTLKVVKILVFIVGIVVGILCAMLVWKHLNKSEDKEFSKVDEKNTLTSIKQEITAKLTQRTTTFKPTKPSTTTKHVPIKCVNVVPGIYKMSRGVDITSLDLYPTSLLSQNGYRQNLFKLSCDQKRTWSSPNIPIDDFALPDQIETINIIPGDATKIKTKLHYELNGVKVELAARVGLDVSHGLFGSFSANSNYKNAQKLYFDNKTSIESIAHVSAVKIEFVSSQMIELNENFLESIRSLPVKYEYNPQLYNRFISTFGKHYFESANFGGLIYQKTVIDNSYLYKTDTEKLLDTSKSKLMHLVTLDSNLVDEDFSSNSQTFICFYGGITDRCNQKDSSYLSKWLNTVSNNPWLFEGRLKPIENLIKDFNMKSQMKKAISVHTAKTFLVDLKDTIEFGKIKLTNKNLKSIENIELYLNNPYTTQNELDKVAKDIFDMFVLVQKIKDRALLQEYYDVMHHFWKSTIKCKASIALGCKTSPMHDEIEKLKYSWNYLWNNKIWKLLQQSAQLDSKEVVELIQEAAKFMHYHETTVVDLCQGNAECQKCLEDNADCWYSEEQNSSYANCKTPTEWRIIQYHPKKVSPCSFF